jgi:exodeoxyribonuclease VII large subunit
MPSNQHIFSVAELATAIRNVLEGCFAFVSVSGEISNLRQPASAHLYFTLKDEQAQLKAVLFRMQRRYLERQPRDGDRVICRGRLSVYEQRGDYQLIVEGLEFQGAGSLHLAFARLKHRLAEEGLFAEENKKPLPSLPGHITLVTSSGWPVTAARRRESASIQPQCKARKPQENCGQRLRRSTSR